MSKIQNRLRVFHCFSIRSCIDRVKNVKFNVPHGRAVRNFGEAVRVIRASNNWSQAELAARVGCSAGYVSLIERAQKDLSLETAAKFADAFGLDLMFGSYRLTAKAGSIKID